jgi:CRP/FNR family cyclic AMP-dependent transcriptional regulator
MAAPMTRAAMREWIASIPLFAALSSDELDTLVAASRSITARKGTRLFEEGAAADCCYVLVSGGARLVLSGHAGTDIILGTIGPKGLVGEVALLDASTRSADLLTTASSLLVRIPAAAFGALRRNPQFETRLVAHVTSLLRSANDQIRGTAASPSIVRVAWCLARLARREGVNEDGRIVIPKRPHQELGEIAGCSRETVTRALDKLKSRRCVTWDREVYAIDMDALQRVVRHDLQIDSPSD